MGAGGKSLCKFGVHINEEVVLLSHLLIALLNLLMHPFGEGPTNQCVH
jgi:hypothetical protein